MNVLASPPVAFVTYLALVWLLWRLGKVLSGPSTPPPEAETRYASGEAPPTRLVSPGYRGYYTVALFFAMLHLGVLVVATGGLTPPVAVYLGVLLATLLAFLWG